MVVPALEPATVAVPDATIGVYVLRKVKVPPVMGVPTGAAGAGAGATGTAGAAGTDEPAVTVHGV